ncbi:MAG: hypothetical protein QOH49_5166 [Acidobacteriota bacterium]|jgi:tetratricopeptide (TPR) repeat protein|nr:hypothetical protein [Acidobacteriota bacterium]
MSQKSLRVVDAAKEAIRLALDNRKLALFVGAGLSKGAGLPSWVELIKPLAEAMGTPFPANPVDINDRHLLKTADQYEFRMRRPALTQYLNQRLAVLVDPTSVHELIARMPIVEIFTTNYDDLIERALKDAGKGCNCVIHSEDFQHMDVGDVTVYKLCGDLVRRESVLITETDFFDFFEKKKLLVDRLRISFALYTTLFLGYSMQDPFFKYIWYRSGIEFGPDQRQGYAVMFNADQHDIYDLQRRNITVINLEAKPNKRTEALAGWLGGLIKPAEGDGASDLYDLLTQVIEIGREREPAPDEPAFYEDAAGLGEQIKRAWAAEEGGVNRYSHLTAEDDRARGRMEVALNVGKYAFLLGKFERECGQLDMARQLCELSWKIMKTYDFYWGQLDALGELVLIALAAGELERSRWFATEHLNIAKATVNKAAEAWASRHLAIVARLQGDYDGARELCERSLRICETDKYDTAEVLHELCLTAQCQGDLKAASEFALRSTGIGEGPEQAVRLAWIQHQQGRIARLGNDLAEARLLCEHSLQLYEKLNHPVELATVLNDLSLIAQDQGDYAAALTRCEDSLRICDEEIKDERLANPVRAWALNQRGRIARRQGRLDEAWQNCRDSLKLYERLGEPIEITTVLTELSLIANDKGRLDEAYRHAERSLKLSEARSRNANIAEAAYHLGLLDEQRSRHAEALSHFAKSLRFYQVLNESERIRECTEQIEAVAERTGNFDTAVNILQRAVFFYRQPGTPGATIIEACLKLLKEKVR